jgi:thymidine phosphorylase
VAEEAIRSGIAVEKMREWFEAQGATKDVVSNLDLFPRAPIVKPILNTVREGWIGKADARTIGIGVMRLGGGRKRKEDTIDISVGIEMKCHVGAKSSLGDPLFIIHAQDEETADKVAQRTLAGIEISADRTEEIPLILA